MSSHQLAAPGKLLRPSLCLWAALASGGEIGDAMPGALAVEWIHNFTLVHDDVQDGDRLRRHRPTVWAVWGEHQAINAGDAMCAQAFALLSGPGPHEERRLRCVSLLAGAVQRVVEGQCLDLAHEGNPELATSAYLRMARLKTGALLGASLAIGAVLAGAGGTLAGALGRAGETLGLAFQVRDDWLGVWGDPAVTGKPAGDLARRKVTYPVVAAYAAASSSQRRELKRLFARPDPGATMHLYELFTELGGPGLIEDVPLTLAQEALAPLRISALEPGRLAELEVLAAWLARRTS